MFDISDIDTMLLALDAYESKFAKDAMMNLMLGAMLTKKEDRTDLEAEAERKFDEATAKGEAVKETVILLKAKLIKAKRELMVGDVREFMTSV